MHEMSVNLKKLTMVDLACEAIFVFVSFNLETEKKRIFIELVAKLTF